MSLYWMPDQGWAFVNLFFDRTLDLYTRFLKPYNDETHPGVLLFTMASIPTTDTYGMNLNVSPKIGCWQPQLNGGMYFYDADVRSLGITGIGMNLSFILNLIIVLLFLMVGF